MSSGQNSPPLASPSVNQGRRASVTGQTFQDLFSRNGSSNGQPPTPSAYPGPITTAAVNAQRRRLSLTTIGLSASPNQTSPFTAARPRTESLSSANSGSVDESPFEEDTAASASSNPTTPFGRRLSFGARAMRDVRAGGGNNTNGRASIRKVSSPPTDSRGRGLSASPSSALPSPSTASYPSVFRRATIASGSAPPSSPLTAIPPCLSVFPSALEQHFSHRPSSELDQQALTSMILHPGEGFNFAESLRTRAERTSMSGAHPVHSPAAQQQQQQHQRAKSVATLDPPAREMPKPRVPDAFQERILKGDFYMD